MEEAGASALGPARLAGPTGAASGASLSAEEQKGMRTITQAAMESVSFSQGLFWRGNWRGDRLYLQLNTYSALGSIAPHLTLLARVSQLARLSWLC